MTRLPLANLTRPRRAAFVVAVGLLILAVLALGSAAVIRMSGGGTARPAPSQPGHQRAPSAGDTIPEVAAPSLGPQQASAAKSEIARLRAQHLVQPATSSGHPAISGNARKHPDLYAAAFVNGLLTQDYRTSRSDLLAWVQAESAQTTEPSVIGLVPAELRDRWAVFTVTDAGTAGEPPIPTPGDWATLGLYDGHTTVEIQRVTTPIAWSAAVAAGAISDPGITGREVTALVSLHLTEAGRPKTTTTSVAITVNLQGPPTQDGWGFVTAVTYTRVGGSR